MRYLSRSFGAVCHGYYLLTAWSCCYLEHRHGLEREGFFCCFLGYMYAARSVGKRYRSAGDKRFDIN